MKILEQYSSLSPIYQGGLTNHLPMLVTALRLLDVSDEDVKVIAEQYQDEKGIFDLSDNVSPKSKFDEDYIIKTSAFLDLINKYSVDKVIGDFLKDKTNTISSGLFHGVIRLSFAYLSNQPLQIAQALAYYDLISSNSVSVGNEVEVEDISPKFEELIKYRRRGIKFSKSSTYFKFHQVLKEDFIRNNLFYPKNIYKNKDKVLDFIVDAYNKTDDFYMLHVITGFQALHILEQFFDDLDELYRNFFMDSLVFMLFYNHNRYKEVGSQMEFPHLIKHVSKLRDAHDIKLFYSLVFLYERYYNDKLKTAATKIFKKNNLF